jgi:mannitol/fructose-specific phosphotransferase system IIA component (Ntr-type)
VRFADLLHPDAVKVPLDASNRDDAIRELVGVLVESGAIPRLEAGALIEAVLAREQQRSTGIGEGLAVPHAKSHGIQSIAMAAGTLREPVDFHSIDRQPVRLVCMIVAPPDRIADHIQALARVSRLFSSAHARNSAFGATSTQALRAVFTAADPVVAA